MSKNDDDTVPSYRIRGDVAPMNAIAFVIGGVEKLRIEPGGFFVDGVLVNNDPEKIYEALSLWVRKVRKELT